MLIGDKDYGTGIWKSGAIIIRQFFLSSLYNNAFYLILNSAVIAILGFVFWNLMAHTFSPAAVGIGSALFSAAGLISTLANFGLGNGLVRFIPEVGNKGRQLVYSTLTASGIAAFFTSLAYIAGTNIWSPAFGFLLNNPLLFFGFIVMATATAVSNLIDSSFIAQRAAKYTFFKNFIVSLVKMPLPSLVFFALGGFGIFLGSGVAVIIAVVIAFAFFIPSTYSDFSGAKLDFGQLWHIIPFSFSNYLATIFTQAIGFVLPLMVLSIQGAESNAYFFIAWTMASIIAIIPVGISTSLFAECAHHPAALSHHVRRSFWLSLALLVPAVGIIFVMAPFILGIFGHNYASHGVPVLRWLLLTNFPLTVCSFYNTVNQVRKKLSLIILLNFAISALSIGLSYYLLKTIGLIGIAIGYGLAMLFIAIVVAIPLWRAVHDVPEDISEI